MSYDPTIRYLHDNGLQILFGLFGAFMTMKLVRLGAGLIYPGSMAEVKVTAPDAARHDWKPQVVLQESSLRGVNDPGKLQCFDPATRTLLGYVDKTTNAELRDKITKARLAQLQWKHSSFDKRRTLLKTLSEFIIKNQDDIVNVSSRDTGKTFVDAFFGEILTTLEKISWLIKRGEEVLNPEYRETGMLTMHKYAWVEYHPRGLVAAIVSWNYPFHNVFGPIVAALFAGNAIIVKPSEYVAWSTIEYYAKIIHAVMDACDVPVDLVQFVIGEAAIGNQLVRSDGVDKVTFIGSPGVGKKVMMAASERLTPLTLELGGKDAAVICEDVDLHGIVPVIMTGTFQNMGQNCVGLERIVIHESIHDAFVEQMVEKVSKMSFGPALNTSCSTFDCGAITMPHHFIHIQQLVDDAVKKGATLLFGGSLIKNLGGQFCEPTILDNVTTEMLIAQEEVFGPVMTIMKFTSDDEAVNIVNSCKYGLGGSVFCNDIQRATAIAERLNVGMCNINDFAVNYLCQSLPFGGVKTSGFGRFAGVEGLRDECNMKSMTCDKIPFIKTTIPTPLQYPLKGNSKEFCRGMSRMFYADDWLDKLKGLITVTKASMKSK